MTNTSLLEGKDDPKTSCAASTTASTASARGGQVEPATGDFVFGITEAYLIEKARTKRARPPADRTGPTCCAWSTRSGTTSDWTGTCEDGQSVPVSSGQPTLLVPQMTVAAPPRDGLLDRPEATSR